MDAESRAKPFLGGILRLRKKGVSSQETPFALSLGAGSNF